MYGRRQKKFPRSVRTMGARLKRKMGSKRGMNGNGTGDERNGPFCTYASRFILVIPCYLRKHTVACLHAYYTIYMFYTFTHLAEYTLLLLLCSNLWLSLVVKT